MASGQAADGVFAALTDPSGSNFPENSTQMLEALRPLNDALGLEGLVEMYANWTNNPSRDLHMSFEPPLGDGVEGTDDSGKGAGTRRRLDELTNFGIGAFWSAGTRSANLGKAAAALQAANKTAKDTLHNAWHGKAADTATGKLDELDKAIGEYAGVANGFGQALNKLWSAVRPPMVDLCNVPTKGAPARLIAKRWGDEYTGGQNMFLANLKRACDWGRDSSTFGANSEVAEEQSSSTGPINPQDIRMMSVDIDEGMNSKWTNEFCLEMDEFAALYSDALKEYRNQINVTYDAVFNAVRAFNECLDAPTDPFAKFQVGGQSKPPGRGPGPGPGPDPGPGPGSGPDTKPQSASFPPPGEQPKPPEMPDPGKNPVTGQPLEIDPSTGQPYPIDPKTGQPIKDADPPETMTVKHGDDTIAMSEPDKDGKMDIKVDDGHGHDKDYKLDWGDDDKKASDVGKPGGPVATVPLASPNKDGFGPQGTPDGQPGPDGSYQPGPDGKIHIQDGDLKITAERPQGPGGPTIVTVDDGSGTPTSYTLGEDGKGGPASYGLTDQPGGAHPAPGHDGVAGGPGGNDRFDAPGGVHAGGDAAAGADVGGQSTQPSDLGTFEGSGGGDHGGGAPDAGGGVSSGGGDALAAGGGGETPVQLGQGAMTSSGAPGAAPGGPGVGVAPGGADPHAAMAASAGGGPQGAGGAAGAGGMGMMGGMGGMAGGGQGGDQERSSSPYRVDGGLFENTEGGVKISGSIGDEDRSISF